MADEHTHEVEITANGTTRRFRFAGDHAHTLWTDLYNSCALVDGGREPEQTTENGVWKGRIDVPTPWPEVVRVIDEDAGLCTPNTIRALRSSAPDCLITSPNAG